MASVDYHPSTVNIRLLTLQRDVEVSKNSAANPSVPGDLVSCSSRSTLLFAAPAYVALSYVWGDPNDKTSINLDGRPKQVTRNLEGALRQLRDSLQPLHALWVDAICINQDNQEEKSEQVRHMRFIYSRAEYVICWLGPASPDGYSRMGMQWTRDFGARAWELGIGTSPEMYLRVLLSQLEDRTHSLAGGMERFLKDLIRSLDRKENPSYDPLLAGLQNILGRE